MVGKSDGGEKHGSEGDDGDLSFHGGSPVGG